MKQRICSAIVLIAIVLVCVPFSEVTRVLFFAASATACAYELSRNLEKLEIYCCAWVMYVYIAAQALLSLLHAGPIAYLSCFACGVYLAMFSGILHKKVSGHGALYTVAGLGYPCFLFSMMMMISVSDLWLETLVIGSLAAWVCDSFALFGGMLFGKHKLAPLVSPKKTVEGCLCGALSSFFTAGLIYLLRLFPALSLRVLMLTCLIASTVGQIGDLAESLLKRMIGIKDFSKLIPGHGGMFDRADSLLFSIPITFVCLVAAGYAG